MSYGAQLCNISRLNTLYINDPSDPTITSTVTQFPPLLLVRLCGGRHGVAWSALAIARSWRPSVFTPDREIILCEEVISTFAGE